MRETGRETVPADQNALTRALQVLAERLGHDEQYADENGAEFDYTIDYG